MHRYHLLIHVPAASTLIGSGPGPVVVHCRTYAAWPGSEAGAPGLSMYSSSWRHVSLGLGTAVLWVGEWVWWVILMVGPYDSVTVSVYHSADCNPSLDAGSLLTVVRHGMPLALTLSVSWFP